MVEKAKSDLGTRVLTALIGGSLFLSILVWGGTWGAVALTLVLTFGMLWEFGSMVFSLADRRFKRWLLVGFGVLLTVFHALWGQPGVSPMPFLAAFLVICFFFLFATSRLQESDLSQHVREWAWSIFGMFYFGYLTQYFMALRQMDDGLALMGLFLILIWAADSGAYLVGRKLGKTKLFVRVSPKKSWEGLIGGVLISVGLGLVYSHHFLQPFHSPKGVILMTLIVLVSVVGDLCESLLKRGIGVKDSGSLLPGHGGFLDRFDSIVFSLPFMYAGSIYLGF